MSDAYEVTAGTPLTANGSSANAQIKQAVRDLTGMSDRQIFTITCQGTWDGATVNVEHSIDGGTTWIADSELAFTENASKVSELSRNARVRGTMSSAGASSSVKVYLS